LVTAYLPKGIRAVHADQDKIAALKFSDFNLGDRKVYSMLAPHKYLTRTKGKNSKIIPQSWTHNLAVHTAQCHEDPALRKTPRGECMCQVVVVLLPWRIFVVKPSHNSGSDIDQSDHGLEYARP
jgi:hypothetical protein